MTKALILGGYGLIGAACLRALRDAGVQVVGLGRSATAAARVDPDGDWLFADMARMTVADWQDALAGVDVVVNAAGALQDSGRDDLAGVHATAPERLVTALQGSGVRVIQISAVGVSAQADTAFYRTKACGDAAVRGYDGPWVILRPGLVLASAAYGGTALLRAAAALPGIAPQVYPRTRIQTVAMADLTHAVILCAQGAIRSGTEADLVEPEAHSLPRITRHLRRWLGLPPARLSVPMPAPLLSMIGRGADALAWLGWRSPLRSTALRVLATDVTGDPGPWAAAGGPPCRSLADTLRSLPATVQDRWFARLWPLLPLSIAVLSLFWLTSGLVGLWQWAAAAEVLTARGTSPGVALAAVVGGGLADVALGLAILWRRWARAACVGMAILATAYLLGGTILTPDLWSDPLGPFTKILPAVLLPLMTAAMLEDR